jgi:hypothetical protein
MLIINPGTGPIADATLTNAKLNIAAFIGELVASGRVLMLASTEPTDGGDGRWTFQVRIDGRWRKISMPGLPLDRVRFTGEGNQNIWDFPRLYVDGSSWIWGYALDICEGDE